MRVYRQDSLTTEPRFEWEEDLTGLLEVESFDLVIGNPPAGHLPEEFRGSVGSYEFASQGRLTLCEVAFLEQALRLTRAGGRVALILPEGLFANVRTRPLREYLHRETTVEMVVGLPRGTFPFTPAKMCILLLYKQPPPPKHCALLAEVSEEAKLGEELATIAQVYKERRKTHG
ncbi:MAG TPA: hypothetical protein EYP85_07195 [Armatimonadetes bacterium]|nr:hypothetical protein [Armatimonadota bacterium]